MQLCFLPEKNFYNTIIYFSLPYYLNYWIMIMVPILKLDAWSSIYVFINQCNNYEEEQIFYQVLQPLFSGLTREIVSK
jgi:hypothetical protein